MMVRKLRISRFQKKKSRVNVLLKSPYTFPSFPQGDFPHLQGLVDVLPHFLPVPVHFAGCKCLLLAAWLRLEGLHGTPSNAFAFSLPTNHMSKSVHQPKMFEPWSYFKRSVTKYGIFDITEIGVLFLSNVFNNCWHFGGLVVLPCLNIVMH